jgi:endonuclease/exonuclease/phosphatase family metal-dependent hydrolase
VKNRVVPVAAVAGCFFVVCALLVPGVQAQSNLALRVMAANITSGTQQSYEGPGIRIFQGLKPDVIAIQEFQYNSSSASNDLRTLVNTAFGSEFSFYCEPSGSIPNGIVSRWPILAAGSWDDPLVSDRGFAWAQIDLPGSNDLYVVSVHLYGSGSASDRGTEAAIIKAHVQTNFPAGAWVIVGGDMNTTARTEVAITTFKTFLSDSPIPTDLVAGGNPDTNEPRNNPYDYVLPSFGLTNYRVPTVIGAQTFNNGLVFDSTVYANNYTLAAVSPVQSGDSHVSGMQHMAVIKDFLIPVGVPTTNAPSITTQPASQTNAVGANASFSVVATGTAPLAYQWRFFGTNFSGATNSSLSLTNLQTTNAGDYTVVITNVAGSVTSSVATLTVTTGPAITNQPQGLSVLVGQNATFNVGASGVGMLGYQWRCNASDLTGATNATYTRTNAQLADAGNYTVVVTNSSGSVTSAVAVLVVNSPTAVSVIAQWNFNSVPPDASTTTGTVAPSVGNGTASLFGGTTATFATGDTTLDPAGSTDNSGWNTAAYPAQGTGNKTRGAQFNVSTLGRQSIVITWTHRISSSASKYARLQYTTNGTDFLDFPTPITMTADSVYERKTNVLSAIPAVNHNANFAFRIVSEFESTAIANANANYVTPTGTTYGTAGTHRFDMVTVWGSDLIISNPPAIAPALTNAALIASQFQFQLTGTTGSNYIVQAATDLGLSNWISLRTNAAPFTFVESNVFTLPQRFYRGLVAP